MITGFAEETEQTPLLKQVQPQPRMQAACTCLHTACTLYTTLRSIPPYCRPIPGTAAVSTSVSAHRACRCLSLHQPAPSHPSASFLPWDLFCLGISSALGSLLPCLPFLLLQISSDLLRESGSSITLDEAAVQAALSLLTPFKDEEVTPLSLRFDPLYFIVVSLPLSPPAIPLSLHYEALPVAAPRRSRRPTHRTVMISFTSLFCYRGV